MRSGWVRGGGGATTTGPDATQAPAICQNLAGRMSPWGGGGGVGGTAGGGGSLNTMQFPRFSNFSRSSVVIVWHWAVQREQNKDLFLFIEVICGLGGGGAELWGWGAWMRVECAKFCPCGAQPPPPPLPDGFVDLAHDYSPLITGSQRICKIGGGGGGTEHCTHDHPDMHMRCSAGQPEIGDPRHH